MPDSLTEDGRYAPRFIDEIYSEMDILDNKNDKTYSKYINFRILFKIQNNYLYKLLTIEVNDSVR
jgi:hypothetical protein